MAASQAETRTSGDPREYLLYRAYGVDFELVLVTFAGVSCQARAFSGRTGTVACWDYTSIIHGEGCPSATVTAYRDINGREGHECGYLVVRWYSYGSVHFVFTILFGLIGFYTIATRKRIPRPTHKSYGI